jgi:hypothetical protein
MSAEYVKAPGTGLGFYAGTDGYLYCDGLRVDDIRQTVQQSPFYLYSQERIKCVPGEQGPALFSRAHFAFSPSSPHPPTHHLPLTGRTTPPTRRHSLVWTASSGTL